MVKMSVFLKSAPSITPDTYKWSILEFLVWDFVFLVTLRNMSIRCTSNFSAFSGKTWLKTSNSKTNDGNGIDFTSTM